MLRLIACERHSTVTKFETGPMRPAPPVSLACPLCIAERNDDHSGDGTSTRERIVNAGGVVVQVSETGRPTAHELRVAEATERMWERMRAEGRIVDPEVEAVYVAESTAQSRENEILDRLPKSERVRRRRSSSGRWGPDGEWLSYA